MNQASEIPLILQENVLDVDKGCWFTPLTSIYWAICTIDTVMARIIPSLKSIITNRIIFK
jgi:hypothetical protein